MSPPRASRRISCVVSMVIQKVLTKSQDSNKPHISAKYSYQTMRSPSLFDEGEGALTNPLAFINGNKSPTNP